MYFDSTDQYYSLLIIDLLSNICNLSLAAGTIRNRFNFSIIKPIHRKGEKLNIQYGRPIFYYIPNIFYFVWIEYFLL
jgi:hypothetical protein